MIRNGQRAPLGVGRRLATCLAVLALAGTEQLLVAPVLGLEGPSGSVVAHIVDPAGTPLAGSVCLQLFLDGGGGARGKEVPETTLCDVGSEDQLLELSGAPAGAKADDRADGVIAWTGLAAGSYVVVEARRPTDGGRGWQLAADASVSVASGVVTSVSLRHFPLAAITIDKVDPSGAALPGACFSLIRQGGGASTTISGCDGGNDNHFGPGDGKADGVLVLRLGGSEVEPGTFTLRETRPPDGYVAAADRTVDVVNEQATTATVTDTTGGGASLVVQTVDSAGISLTGACFEVWTDRGGGTKGSRIDGTSFCDAGIDAGGLPGVPDQRPDGTLVWTGLAAGRYVLVETLGPRDPGAHGYRVALDAPLTLSAGAVLRLDVHHDRLGVLTVFIVDGTGAPLGGACFSLVPSGGTGTTFACDGPADSRFGPGDGTPDGVLQILPIDPATGGFTLHQTHAPNGYAASPDESVSIDTTVATAVLVTDVIGPGGSIVARLVDPAGELLTGTVCLELWSDAGTGARGKVVPDTRLCDASSEQSLGELPGGKPAAARPDGKADGVIAWTGLAGGKYVVVEVRGPSDGGRGYQRAADAPVGVNSGSASSVTLRHFPNMALTIDKVDPAGAALPGACFALISQTGTISACDGPDDGHGGPGDQRADGVLVLSLRGSEATPGIFTLHETRPPDGYVAVADQTVEIASDRATATTVTDTTSGGASSGGSGTGGAPIIGLQLDIDSTITIAKYSSYPAEDKTSRTSAAGQIALTGDETAGWHGTGNLASSTNVTVAISCAKITITGKGSYDWTVSAVHAGPSVAADAITVDMDAGPIAENPDKAVNDTCGTALNTPVNTWENLFFTVYSPDHYKAKGYRIDGWKAVGGPDVWTKGGDVAEATWAASCPSNVALIQECKANTTFRLTAVVTGTGPAPTASAAAPGNGPVITPLPLPLPGDGLESNPGTSPAPSTTGGGPVLDCTDVASCLTSSTSLVFLGGLALVLLLGGILLFRLRSPSTTGAIDPTAKLDPLAKIDPLAKLDPLAKIDPLAKLDPLAKVDPLAKLDPGATLADKIAPLDAWKLNDGSVSINDGTIKIVDPGSKLADPSASPLEPPGTELPPPPGSIG